MFLKRRRTGRHEEPKCTHFRTQSHHKRSVKYCSIQLVMSQPTRRCCRRMRILKKFHGGTPSRTLLPLGATEYHRDYSRAILFASILRAGRPSSSKMVVFPIQPTRLPSVNLPGVNFVDHLAVGVSTNYAQPAATAGGRQQSRCRHRRDP